MPVRVELQADAQTPVSAFLQLSRGEQRAFLFESVEGGERTGRWSFLGAGPRAAITSRCEDAQDPLERVRQLLGEHRAVRVPGMPPFAGGVVGYLSYDAVRRIEPRVPVSRPDELGFPEAVFLDFDTVVAFDALRHTAHVIAEARCSDGDDPRALYAEALSRIQRVLDALGRPLDPAASVHSDRAPVLRPRMERAEFEAAVRKAQEAICAGDCQQIVVSQRFDAEVEIGAFDIYRALRRVNPSPYLYFLRDGDRALVGSSPETLVRLEQGELTVCPIAGTRRRGQTPEEDAALEAELLADEKENAEHLMLVDLGRNDLGRVAEVGSVEVKKLRAIERYSHVMHMVSLVRGRARPGADAIDALRATFPAGTVSGAPKVRAMELIDAIEPARRGPYAGCVGYFDRSGGMEMAITIRTLLQSGRRVSVQAGAGVVFDSVPEAEYAETLNKARALFSAVAQAQSGRIDGGGREVLAAGRPAPRPPRPSLARVLVIDNYDSFTHNLVQYLGELGAEVEVFRNDALDVDGIRARRPDGVLVSPGPCAPDQAGISLAAIRALAGELPILGVCLGHQAIGQAFGGRVVRASRIVHGKRSPVHHGGGGLFAGIPTPFAAGRYHSLVVERGSLPASLEITAWTEEGEVMAVRHRSLDVQGVQFHPESILTEHGRPLLANWLARLAPRSAP